MRVRGAWNNTELVCETHLVDLTLSNREGHLFTISARSVDELNLPTQNTNVVNCKKFEHLTKLQDRLCSGQLKPEILIGQDNYHLLVPLEVVTGTPQEPCATRTPLGWCLHGKAPAQVAHSSHVTMFIANNSYEDSRLLQEIHEEVQRSFTFDSLGVGTKPRPNYDEERALELLERTSTLVNGRWHVGLPWKDENCKMPDSFPYALSRLKAVERKMEKCSQYAERYRDRVQHLFHNDYAQVLTNTEVTDRTWYLSHFGVDNPNKKKLRLVYDAAAKTNGVSLNDYLLKGPDLLKSLFGIMLRFREHRIAVTGDIKDMFLRIKIRNEDQNALRFLYRSNPNEPVKTYVMTSLIFGANCSPFIAQHIKNKNAQRFESTYPAACEAIYNNHYMDDYIHSLPNEKIAIQSIREIKMIHQQGGFEVRNWTCNSKQVLETIPKEDLGEAAVRFNIGEQYGSERTLGLIWYPHEDALGFDVSFKKIPENLINGTQRPTKRDMLRVVMSIFDVYGFLAPFTINGKIILQECWQRNIEWDDTIPDTIYDKWCKWIKCLKELNNIRLPRYYHEAAAKGASESVTEPVVSQTNTPPLCAAPAPPAPGQFTSQLMTDASYTNLELHVFCDASLQNNVHSCLLALEK
ncbi:uncharacterized protein [Choristoneura fumiferana]|uniref:uncharacterized protein n=1 Tax=Choristoneura fumiferana TaxID=7141 RepID=UPI003D15D742